MVELKPTLEEKVEVLYEDERIRIERIESPKGFSNPFGFWYDQNEDELVTVVKGEAVLNLQDEGFVNGRYLRMKKETQHTFQLT